MPLFRTALTLGFALFALCIPAAASADSHVGAAKALTATLGSTATLRALTACHSTTACQLTAARKLQTQVRAMASGVLMQNSPYTCNLLPFERTYGPTQNALTAWAARPGALHTRVAMRALRSWFRASDVAKACLR